MKDYEQLIELLKVKGFDDLGNGLLKRGLIQTTVFQDGAIIVRISHINIPEWIKDETNELTDFVSSKIYIENFL